MKRGIHSLILFGAFMAQGKHSYLYPEPTVAAVLSIIPGVGQIYNRQIWKAPVVWGLMGMSSYMTFYFYRNYREMRTTYIQYIGDTNPILPPQLLYDRMMFYRRWFEFWTITTILIYIASIGDAYVSAHLSSFPGDWTATISPAGVTICLDLKGKRRKAIFLDSSI